MAPSYTGPELCRLQAHEVVAMLRKGKISPDELLDAAYTRIAQVEPRINAMVTLCRKRAENAAKALDKNDGGHAGWLAGLPLGIKDLTPVAGVRTTYGTKGLADFVPQASDPLVLRIERRGGIVVGKTNTPEMGAGANTFNEVFGATLNPWDTSLNPGGSSGGAAASLATGEVWLNQGSDHGGSLRTPAGYCGVVGLRPSPGRAASASDSAFISEGQCGPMARSIRDCALFLDAMSGFNPAVADSYPEDVSGSFQDAVIAADTKIRIAFTPDLGGFAQVDDEVRDHLTEVMGKMETSGARVELACPELPNLERTYHTLRGVMWTTAGRRMPERVSRHFKETLAENTRFGESLAITDVADAHLDRTVIHNNMAAFLRDFDVLACPTVGCMPHRQDEEWVREVGGVKLDGYMDWLRFAFPATTAALPAISVPVGPGPRGLPIGIQLIGPPRGEAKLLAAARAFEMVAGGPATPIDPASA